MIFEPQIPKWGLNEFEQYKEKLINYHNWLYTTGIKTGLISKKSQQFIWDEFIVHSLYFHQLIKKYNFKSKEIYDLGTGGGIPGVPISIVNKRKVNLIDNKKTRIYELQRLVKTLNLENAIPKEEDANFTLKNLEKTIVVMRCYVSTLNIVKIIQKYKLENRNIIFLVSSSSENKKELKSLFHVKQEKFLINKNNFRTIDVITDM
jgi:16S rRNA G527 N7-methylase RsmG